MRQVLGQRKHRLCEDISGRTYVRCYTTRSHHIATCWLDERNADLVDYQQRHWCVSVRDGQTVETEEWFQQNYLSVARAQREALAVLDALTTVVTEPLTAETAYWHACTGQEWTPKSTRVPLVWDDSCTTGSISFLANPFRNQEPGVSR
jgi:hypothetical protein